MGDDGGRDLGERSALDMVLREESLPNCKEQQLEVMMSCVMQRDRTLQESLQSCRISQLDTMGTENHRPKVVPAPWAA